MGYCGTAPVATWLGITRPSRLCILVWGGGASTYRTKRSLRNIKKKNFSRSVVCTADAATPQVVSVVSMCSVEQHGEVVGGVELKVEML